MEIGMPSNVSSGRCPSRGRCRGPQFRPGWPQLVSPGASTHSSPVNREAGVLEVPHAEAEDATLALAELLRMLREHGEPGEDWVLTYTPERRAGASGCMTGERSLFLVDDSRLFQRPDLELGGPALDLLGRRVRRLGEELGELLVGHIVIGVGLAAHTSL